MHNQIYLYESRLDEIGKEKNDLHNYVEIYIFL